MKRAVIYARFSSDMQREESIEAQVRACRDYAKRQGYVVTHIYKDEAKSGKSLLGRDGYNTMMEDVKQDLFDVIIFHKIDRNARNEFNYYQFKDIVSRYGVSYEYAAQSIDYSPEGQMMEAMLVGYAAYYSRNLSKETKKGLNENAYKAIFNGGVAPLGYTIVDKRYEIEPYEAEAVKLIFSMYLDGHGYGAIAEALAAKGFKTRNGKNFAKNSLHDILQNERYTGTYIFNKTHRKEGRPRNMHGEPSEDIIRVENAFPAIIDRVIFERAQEKRRSNRKRSASYNAADNFLLSGKVFCALCGSPMHGHSFSPRPGVRYSYYVCDRKERVPGDKCLQKSIRKDYLERWILDRLLEDVLSPAGRKKVADYMASAFERFGSTTQAEIKKLQATKAGAEARQNNLYNLIELGDFSAAVMDRLKSIKQELATINEKLEELRRFDGVPTLSRDEIMTTLCLFQQKVKENNDNRAKKILIDLFVRKVSISTSDITLEISCENVADYLVPRTGIEPVRVSLPEGF